MSRTTRRFRASATMVLVALAGLLLGIRAAQADELVEYAKACEKELGAAIPGFDCTAGHELAMNGTEGGTCEKPPYLPNAGCYAGSRIQQLQSASPEVLMIALCRKKRAGNRAEQFDDIAIIATRHTTGATCFFQRLVKGTDGRVVPAPKDDVNDYWMKPAVMAETGNACVQCHDNGAFLRTPYVMQQAANVPAYDKKFRNKTAYWFPGNNFVGWNGKVFRATVDGNSKCTVCHTMGANSIDNTLGTSAWLGPMSTGAEVTEFLNDPITGNSTAHWMTPSRVNTQPDHNDQIHSQTWRDCAQGKGGPECHLTLWDGQMAELQRNRYLPPAVDPSAPRLTPRDRR